MDTNQHIPSGYKPSPLGIIPEDWEVKRLGEICTFLRNNTLSRNQLNEINGKVQNVHYGDILVKYPSVLNARAESIPYVNQEDYKDTLNEFIEDGDVIMADTAEDETVGKACEIINVDSKQILAGLHTMLIRPQKGLFASSFLGYHINSNSYRRQLNALIQGIKVCSLGKQVIANTFLLLPPLPEQQRIVSVLSLWDTAIAKQTALIEQLTLRKRGLMQQLLTGKKRLKGFEGKWKEVRLGEVFDERNETNRDDLPLLSITGDKGVIYQSESDKRDISNEDKSKYKRICPNDIGYNTMRMWQGRSALSELEGIVSPAYTIVTPKVTIDVRFMAMLIQQPRIVYGFWTHSQGLVSDTLNCKYPDFCQVRVTIPSKKEQTAIANFFIQIDKEIEIQKQKLAALQEQKKGLMQVLLTGKRRMII